MCCLVHAVTHFLCEILFVLLQFSKCAVVFSVRARRVSFMPRVFMFVLLIGIRRRKLYLTYHDVRALNQPKIKVGEDCGRH